ncbi:MAG: polysaccharide deacetylase family protein [Eubacterium sp.]|nr:polysaccharide deacetylase family protein [Eubacterium sp.]
MLLLCIAAGTMAESKALAITGGMEQSGITQPMMKESDVSMQDLAEKKVALTFDDGPNAKYTEGLLEGLKERGVQATFFLLGHQVEKSPEIVKKMHEDGHLIGNHSYEHVNLSSLSDEAAMVQVDKTNEAIYQVTGEFPEYIRPPFGCWKSNLDYKTTMIEVLWNVDPLDWKTDNTDAVVQKVLKEVEENDIILLHDASESSVNAAFRIIDTLKKEGFVFVTVDEILFD